MVLSDTELAGDLPVGSRMPALAVRTVSVVLVQLAQGMDSADCCGRSRCRNHAVVHLAPLRLAFPLAISVQHSLATGHGRHQYTSAGIATLRYHDLQGGRPTRYTRLVAGRPNAACFYYPIQSRLFRTGHS